MLRFGSVFRSKFFAFACAAAVVAGIVEPAVVRAAENDSIRIAVEGAFPPFNYVDSNNQLQGFDVDIANALCETAKLKCEFVIQEWTAMIPNLLDNKYDAIISSMSMSAERRQKVAFTQKYYDSPTVFIARKNDEIAGTSPDDLKKLRLGVTAATSQESYAKKFYGGVATTVFHASPDLYKGLADGKVDIILEDKLAVYDWLANTKAGSCCAFKGEDIKNTEYFGDGAGIAVRPTDTALLDKLNAALEEIEANDTYDTINAKYFPFSIR
ncbi:transporter substrate-binding domain-containing protein [Rhizobium mesosinicum]|uniref:Transporter substrate-binding domain-containing protein n=1 Tax=Rhizobium mesosinicum TaxID=335017 RepID=A0ABS7GQ32_9HYPH|nr:transporter substrate-binding domain-containing protein [Rhizobium mesosinicum]MBW9051418.1 transporter substrate-binding domain-containing protein [Rhizobium mesosinicum]